MVETKRWQGTHVTDLRGITFKNKPSYFPVEWNKYVIRQFFNICCPVIIGLLGERNCRDSSPCEEYLMKNDVKERLNQFLRLSWPFIKGDLPECKDISLVYGHTHKPIAKIIDLDEVEKGINKSIPVYNTGGWVVDRTKADNCFGASIVLMNRTLDLVSVQVYREGKLVKPLIESLSESSGFRDYINEKVEREPSSCWKDLMNSVNTTYGKKVESLDKQLKMTLREYKTSS